MKTICIKLIADAEKEFEDLNKTIGEEQSRGIENSENQQLMRSIKRTSKLIKENPQYGIQISQKLIPKKYAVDNLWKVNLTGFWRMLYTLKGNELEIICFVLEICNHKKYNKLFGYRN
jgi:hypothetical protein